MSENTITTDAELVAGHLAGDRSAFAAIYDRYGEALYDVAAAMLRNRHDAADVTQDTFVVAAERMAQLRDPSRLKPWLMAILRNEVYRRSGRRSRQIPTDFTMVEAEMALPPAAPDDASGAEFQELATLVRDAAAGLDDRDQLVLELAIRQGLEGDDLASALGVTPQQSYSLVHRMRQRTERSLAAFCLARRGRRDCPQLDEILAGWDGQFSVLIRKRVARHIDDCSTCDHNRKKLVPLMLFGAAPAFAAPPDLRERVLGAVDAGTFGLATTAVATRPYEFTAPGGFPSAAKYSRRAVLWWLMGAAAVMLVLGAGVFVVADQGNDTYQLAIDVPDAPATTVVDSGEPPTSPPGTPVAPAATAPVFVIPTAPTTPTSSSPATNAPATIAPTAWPPKTTTTSTSTSTTTTTSTTSSTTTTTEPEVAPPPPETTTTTAVATTSTTTTAPPLGALFLSTGTLDFGASTTALTAQLTNDGAGAADWNASVVAGFANGSPFTVAPASGTLPPGGIVTITVTMDRSGRNPGDYSAAIRFTAQGTTAQLTARGSVPEPDPPPTITITRGPTYTPCEYLVTAAFAASDDAGSPTVTGVVTGGGASFPMGVQAPEARAVLGNANQPPPPGEYTVTLTATDSAGGTASTSGTFTVSPCVIF